MVRKLFLLSLFIICVNIIHAQYISEVLEYKPAPGQFINDAAWGTPASAQSLIGKITGHLTLGSFGGYVIFKFDNPVKNDPDNPFGVDFTIFGNPLKSPILKIVSWSEHGIVSVMKDENGNGKPDDTWYELAGSDYFFSTTRKKYSVTYINPNQAVATDVPWTDNFSNSGKILKNEYHEQPYYPLKVNFPDVNQVKYTLTGTQVEDEVDMSDPSYVLSVKKAFGYVDNQIRNLSTMDYLMPDNPYTLGVENSGGDAFDISWAVDEDGNYVDLDAIDFVKIHNAVLANAGWLGEISTEVTGAVDVPPNASITGVNDMVVIKHLPKKINGNSFKIEVAVFENGRYNPDAKVSWKTNLVEANVNDDNILKFSKSGKLKVTATLDSNPEITASDSTLLVYDGTVDLKNIYNKVILYPNPAYDNINISGVENVNIQIFNVLGKKVFEQKSYSSDTPILVSDFAKGVYIVKIKGSGVNTIIRFVKN